MFHIWRKTPTGAKEASKEIPCKGTGKATPVPSPYVEHFPVLQSTNKDMTC